MEKLKVVFGRLPVGQKNRFIEACKKLRTTQQFVLIDAVDKAIKRAAEKE